MTDSSGPAPAPGVSGGQESARPSSEQQRSSVARASALMALGTLVSRVLGLGRQAMLTGVFGATVVADAFNSANTMPNILFELLSAGVLNAVLIPQITKAMRSEDGGQDFVDRLLTVSLVLILGLTVVGTLAAPWLMDVTTQLSGPALHLSVLFAFLCLPQILFYGVFAVLSNVLNARNHFAAVMWAPALANIVQIGGIATFLGLWGRSTNPSVWTPAMVWTLAGTMTLGIAVQALVLVVPLLRSGFRWRPRWGVRGYGLGEVSKMVAWTLSALVIAQLGGLLNQFVMTGVKDAHADVAGLSVHANAYSLFILPYSLITVSILTATYPQMTRAWHDGDRKGLRRLVNQGLVAPSVAIIPASIGMVAIARPLVDSLLPGLSGREANDVALTLQIMSLATLAFGVTTLQQRYCFTREEGRGNFYYQVLKTGLQVAFAGLAWWVAPPRFAVFTVAIGLLVSNAVTATVFMSVARRQLHGLGLGKVVRLWIRLLCASLFAGLVAWLVVVGMAWFGKSWLVSLATCAVAGVVFLIDFWLASKILRIHEVEEFVAPIRRRFPF